MALRDGATVEVRFSRVHNRLSSGFLSARLASMAVDGTVCAFAA